MNYPKFSEKAQRQLQEYACQFALAALRKLPELLEALPELDTRPTEARSMLTKVATALHQFPDQGRTLILDVIGSELLLDIPENMYEYPLRRESIRVLIELVYTTNYTVTDN
jgi:hypothetical protein